MNCTTFPSPNGAEIHVVSDKPLQEVLGWALLRELHKFCGEKFCFYCGQPIRQAEDGHWFHSVRSPELEGVPLEQCFRTHTSFVASPDGGAR